MPLPASRVPTERPLVVRCGALGDMVLLTAFIRQLCTRFRQPVDIVTSGAWSEPLLYGQPGVGDIWSLRSRKTPYWLSRRQQGVVRAMRKRGVSATWYCDGNDAALPLLHRTGIGNEWIIAANDHPLRPGEHIIEQYWRLARLTPQALRGGSGPGANLEEPNREEPAPAGCDLQVGQRHRRELHLWLEQRGLDTDPFIAIQVGNKRTMRRGLRRLATNRKYWPKERWAQILRFLRLQHPRHALVMLGTGPEFEINQDIAAAAAIDGVHNAADDLPIPRLIALLERAAGLIGVDSGPAHVAAAVGCPQVVLFGKALPSMYRPWGRTAADVRLLTGRVDGEPNMLGIETQSVMAAWHELKLRERV